MRKSYLKEQLIIIIKEKLYCLAAYKNFAKLIQVARQLLCAVLKETKSYLQNILHR
jgi:hypothetical protein